VGSLFLRKKRQLPVTYIIFLLYGVVFVGVDLWLANALMNLPFGYDDARSLIRGSWLAVSGYLISACLNV
jgi:hypothetical protein